jgi:SAM-dependent methyltransferase
VAPGERNASRSCGRTPPREVLESEPRSIAGISLTPTALARNLTVKFGMSTRDTISRVVSHPRVFEIQTALLGGHRLTASLLPLVSRATSGLSSGTVVDVGGGTASARSLWPAGWTYISLDPDQRLVGFNNTDGTMQRLVGDASKLALLDNSVDVVFMKNVSHHLDNTQWPNSLTEIRRALKPDGYFLFVDALWSQYRLVSRLAWSVDAGRFPRVSQKVENAIAESFDVERVERLTLIHHCIMVTSRPRSGSGHRSVA